MSAPHEVAILMGSKSDWDSMQRAAETLRDLGVICEARVLSAHRTPEALAEYVRQAETHGTKVFIAGAGGAAHLAGAVAAQTTRPVLGVPLDSSPLGGLDALLATVQMPAGVPVATFAVGVAGAINAALMAAAILSLGRPELRDALLDLRRKTAERTLAERLE